MSAPNTFLALGLLPPLQAAASAAGWPAPTPVQAAVLPPALAGRDMLALAPTGSGKTAAFLLPLLQHLLVQPGLARERPRRLRALVLSPTRELALQTAAAARGLLAALPHPPRLVVAVGGASINPQLMALRGGAHLVLATPGRLLDLLDHHALSLDGVEFLVLDEADRLLDAGFAAELDRLLALLPARRQTLLLSATLPDAVDALAERVLRDPLRVEAAAGAEAAAPAIQQRAIVVDSARRTTLLRHLLAHEGWARVLVFVATQYASERVADKLRGAGVAAQALNGSQSSGRRATALQDFQAGLIQVLVATDLAARGIDLPGLAVVLQFDLPRSAVDHTHRIGRTGRAGAAGQAISFILADAPGSEAHFRLIERRQQQRVPREQVPGFEPAAAPEPDEAAAAGPGGVKGRRPSKKDKLRAAAAAATRAARKAAT
ncbi:ATP-dependent RNA helicase RhlE [Rubrivivax sp. A210]|uniref:DEAD/DEAH box helicase n=1 Tax=Rubrivivax sp. A210 TaxID=2772301 RepID=UPI0019187FE3|nr:DEAD/DEAH box helicase [Rubrivivax sp. A210]CAD5374163.1 ATP-dependent RNA helicase RhlE [Rubrivivax sp. A210]